MAVFVEENIDRQRQKVYDDQKDSYMNKMSKTVLGICAVLFPVMGILPDRFMTWMADLGQTFMGTEETAEQIHWFSMTNLSGSLISILLGVAVYLLIVRGWMMRKQADGSKEYVNCWPAVLDLEDYLYRPVLLQVLPAVAGGVCKVLDKLVDVLAKVQPLAAYAEASFFNTIQDPVIVEMKKDIYHGSAEPDDPEEGNPVTHVLGRCCNAVKHLLNATVWKKHPCQTDFKHKLALRYEQFRENMILIGRSMSYGLLLFSLGLCITLIYLLIAAVRMA